MKHHLFNETDHNYWKLNFSFSHISLLNQDDNGIMFSIQYGLNEFSATWPWPSMQTLQNYVTDSDLSTGKYDIKISLNLTDWLLVFSLDVCSKRQCHRKVDPWQLFHKTQNSIWMFVMGLCLFPAQWHTLMDIPRWSGFFYEINDHAVFWCECVGLSGHNDITLQEYYSLPHFPSHPSLTNMIVCDTSKAYPLN